MDFFYDAQIRKYLLQFLRIFSDIKIESKADNDGITQLSRVPIRYADMDRMVGHILNDNNQNAILPSPMMSAWITGMEMMPERRQDPMLVDKVQFNERHFDRDNQEYTGEIGNKYTIERHMPVPYKLTIQLDIWTTTTTTKFQILEQILTLFNPSLQLQSNSNIVDWSNIFEVELTQITYSSRTVPMGTNDDREIATLLFELPIFINPPAKVKAQRIIHQIVENVYDTSSDEINDIDLNSFDPLGNNLNDIEQIIITPHYHQIQITEENIIILLNAHGYADPNLNWHTLFEEYGTFEENVTKIILKQDENIEIEDTDITGYVTFHETDSNKLRFTVDETTLPVETLPPITNIIGIDELLNSKGNINYIKGNRYLILNKNNTLIPDQGIEFNYLPNIQPNDIIEFDDSGWFLSFIAKNATKDHYVNNSHTLQQYCYNVESGTWDYTYIRTYIQGYWRLKFW